MFKQVILSTTRPKTPIFFSSPPVREESSNADHGTELGDYSRRNSQGKQYLGRSLSWDAVVEGESSEKNYKAMKKRSKSAKVKMMKMRVEEERSDLSEELRLGISSLEASEGRDEDEADDYGKDEEDIYRQDDEPDRGESTYGRNSNNNLVSNDSSVSQMIHHLVSAFRNRAQTIKSRINRPIAIPSPCESPVSVIISPRLTSKSSLDAEWLEESDEPAQSFWDDLKSRWKARQIGVFDPQSYFYITWLWIVCIFYLYNCWIIFLRASFPYQTPDNLTIFLTLDYLADTIYLVDILFFKSRVTFVDRGQVIKDVGLCLRHYMKTRKFKLDCLSLIPLDILYFATGVKPILRIPRVLKVQTFWEFFNRIDAMAKWPYFFRVLRTLIYMMFLIHLNACAYYYVSYLEGFDANDWVYRNEGNAYIRCFYFAIRTATSISGKMPKPSNTYEYLFMIVSWLLGIFVFAFLIGQIRDILATATQNKAHFRQIMDSIIRYMDSLSLPCDLKHRVRLWVTHTWDQQKLFDESNILYSLPMKIRTDLALDIHYHMLSRVDLFDGCEKTLLRDIVVKLKHVLFLPGDYICRKGEVGNEMYIVSKGMVHVLRDDPEETIICTLGPGGVFGEISVLGIPGCSRRTATVKSYGFSNLFMLTKADLWETLRNYPEAQSILRNKARHVMRERAQRDKSLSLDTIITDECCIIKEPERPSTPKLLKMVMEVVPPDSACRKLLNRSQSLSTKGQSSSFTTSGLKFTPEDLMPEAMVLSP